MRRANRHINTHVKIRLSTCPFTALSPFSRLYDCEIALASLAPVMQKVLESD